MTSTTVAHSILSIFSGVFVDGHGIRISKDRVFAMSKEYMAPQDSGLWLSGILGI
jgi:hypothetical protein